ncbi:MAG TPA: hypothetical protein VKV28_15475 [Candidatus Binataceae bacterium]|nr:hypothetical protein [Candidatus Binataceae bacterium]
MVGILTLASCARSGPRQAAQQYLLALKTGATARCYAMVSEPERDKLTEHAFSSAPPLAPDVPARWFGPLERVTQYRSEPSRMVRGMVVVPVAITTPNLVLWQRMLANDGPPTTGLIEEQLNNQRYPLLSYTDFMVMVKEHHRWHLVGGFPIQARAAQLRQQAVLAYHNYDFARAAALYHQILALLTEAPFSGSQGLALRYQRESSLVEKARTQRGQAQRYLGRLKVTQVTRQPTSAGQAGIFGVIINQGQRSIDQLKLRVTFYNAVAGAPTAIYYEDHTPLAVPLGFVDFNPVSSPLRPAGRLAFGLALHAPADIQAGARVVVTPVDLIFSADDGPPPKLAAYQERAPNVPPPSANPLAVDHPSPQLTHRLHHHRHHRRARHHLR